MRIILSIYLLLCLSACGFKPILAKDNAHSNILEKIMLLEVEGENRQKLEYTISKALNLRSSSSIDYYLKLQVGEEISSLGVMKNTQATRQRVTVTLNYQLLQALDNKVIDQGNFSLYSGYDVASSEFSNYISANYVSENILKELCNQLRNRLRLVLNMKE